MVTIMMIFANIAVFSEETDIGYDWLTPCWSIACRQLSPQCVQLPIIVTACWLCVQYFRKILGVRQRHNFETLQCQCQCQSWIYIAHKRKTSNALVR